jgi:ribonuclease-3
MNDDKMINSSRRAALLEVAGKIGVAFNNINLLHQALTHTSYANESKKLHIRHNERLEFLGDAVLELVISTYLYKNFPSLPEGELTKARAAAVCEPTLARRARDLNLGKYLLFGRGELATGGRDRASILADAFEAVIGAIYLDDGIGQAQKFILSQLEEDLIEIKNGNAIQDYKTLLQEIVQKDGEGTVAYKIIAESGPDHNKVFQTAVMVNEHEMGQGVGKSKKESEQHAAREALIRLNKIKK